MRWLVVLITAGHAVQCRGVVQLIHTDTEVWPMLDLYRSTPTKLTLAKILNLGINTE